MAARIPQIAYWKWGKDNMQGDLHIKRTREFYERSCLNLLVVLMELEERGYYNAEALKRIKEMVETAHSLKGKLALGIDIRYLFKRLSHKYPEDRHETFELIEGDLNPGGYAGFKIKRGLKAGTLGKISREKILRVYAVQLTDSCHYKAETLADITDNLVIPDDSTTEGEIHFAIKAGSEFANYHVVIVKVQEYERLDLFASGVLDEYEALIESLKWLQLDGLTVDEMGLGLPVEENMSLKKFHGGAAMKRSYQEKTGRDFSGDLLYFVMAPEGRDNERLKVLNEYFELIRERVVEIEDFIYRKTKEVFGREAFVGLHPTFWNQNYLEAFHDGFDWWAVKRDYAQTDEYISMPVRLGMARKNGPVWYNMWYTAGEMTMESYYRETWRNALFGGRTHYHSYITSTEVGYVHEIYGKGDLEKISEMENVISALNDFQETQPDSRVVIISGTQAMCNWVIDNPGIKEFKFGEYEGLMVKIARFADKLVENGFLCDLVPDYEIEYGNFHITAEGKLKYGTQTYDAVILAYPECIKTEVLEFMITLSSVNKNIILAGDCRFYFDGSASGERFCEFKDKISYVYKELPEASVIASILRGWNIEGNIYHNGCRYQDGSVIFVAGGDKYVGNQLVVDTYIQGHRIMAKGSDILAIKLDDEGNIVKIFHTELEYILIDGQNIWGEIKAN